MNLHINVMTLGVTDMPRARKFYETLGWKASASSNEHFTLFKAKGCMLALYGRDALAEDAHVPAQGEGFRRGRPYPRRTRRHGHRAEGCQGPSDG